MSVIELDPGIRAAILDQIKAEQHRATVRDQARDLYPTPGALAKHLEPGTNQTAALDLIDAELVKLADEPGGRVIFSMPPQQGKSTRISQVFPVWSLIQNPDRPIMIASYGEQLAERNGEAIRNHIARNDLGLQIESGSSAKKRWRIAGARGGVLSVGIGSGATGWASGLTIVDDPVKDQAEADSEAYQHRTYNWFTSVALTRLAPGASLAIVLTRWSQRDLAGMILASPDADRWRVVNIPAQADHDPNKGETDPLGREPGEYMISARRIQDPTVPGGERDMTPAENTAYWEQIKASVGSRTWNALYQGRPSPDGGTIFREDWFTAPGRMYDQPMWLVRDDGAHLTTNIGDQLMISVDATFKDTRASDYVAMGVWLRRGADAYLLDSVKQRLDFPSTCDKLRQLAAKWPQATLKLIEDKANGPAIMAALRQTVPGMVPEEPQGSKVARAQAITPLCEAGNVHLPTPELFPWVGDLLEELAAFPNGAHDDQVDQMTQALNRLLLQPLLVGGTYVEDELFEDLDDNGFIYSPY